MVRILKATDWLRPDGYPIAVVRVESQEPFRVDAHNSCALVVILGGSGLHVTGQESWMLSAGDCFVISGSQPHDYRSVHDLQLVNVLCSNKLLSNRINPQDFGGDSAFRSLFTTKPTWRRRRLRLDGHQLAHTEELIDQLERELIQRDDGFQFLATAHFMTVVGYLSRCDCSQGERYVPAAVQIGETIAYLENHYQKNMCVDDLAKMARMSRRSFLRAFRAATGTSPIAHVIQLRIRRATQLLRRHQLSVTAIAFKVGFRDSNYFSRQFRKIMGVSPRKYQAGGAVRESHARGSEPALDILSVNL